MSNTNSTETLNDTNTSTTEDSTPETSTEKAKPGLLTRAGRKVKAGATATGRGIKKGTMATGRGIKKAATAVDEHTPNSVKEGAKLFGGAAAIAAGLVVGTRVASKD